MKLSDAFRNHTDDPCLECKALVLNINKGNNKELMDHCRALREYSVFVEKNREYAKIYGSRDTAVQKTVEYCRENHILTQFLDEHEMEAYTMGLWDQVTEEEEKAILRDILIKEATEDGFADGFAKGQEKGLAEGLEKGREEGYQEIISKGRARLISDSIQTLKKRLPNLSEEEITALAEELFS